MDCKKWIIWQNLLLESSNLNGIVPKAELDQFIGYLKVKIRKLSVIISMLNSCSKNFSRSSHRRCSLKKGVLKSFSFFLIKLLAWKACNIIKKRLQQRYYFLWMLWNFSKHLFWRTSANDCLWISVNFMKTFT